MQSRVSHFFAGLSFLISANGAWAVGEPFTAAPQPDAHCQDVKLTGAYFVEGKPNREYHFAGTCKAELVPGAKKTDMPFPVIIDSSYDTQTKVAYEVVTVTFGNAKLVIVDSSKCDHDPFIRKNFNCTLLSAKNPTAFPLNSSDYPLARKRATEEQAKALSPKPAPKPAPKLDDVQILSPVANQSYSTSVRFQVHMAKHFADDGLSCCELELQNSVGGNWIPFKTLKDNRVAEPKDLNFAHDWFDISKSSKYRVRARPIKKTDYDDAPWSNWVEFFVTGPGVAPGEVPKLPAKSVGPDSPGRAGGLAQAIGTAPLTVQPTIKSLEISPAKVKSSEVVTIKVNGVGTCKYHVDFGNGLSMDREDALPANFQNSFIVATYETRIFTVKVNGLNGCQGNAQASVTVGEPVQANSPGPKLQNVNPAILPKNCPPGARC